MYFQRVSIAQSIRSELNVLIDAVRYILDNQPSVHETKDQLWKGMPASGWGLIQLRFKACSESEKAQKVIEGQGVNYDCQRPS